MRFLFLFLTAALVPLSAQAPEQPPRIGEFGVRRGASFLNAASPGAPGAGLPQGSIFVLQGAWLGPEEIVTSSPPFGFRLPDVEGGTRVEVRSLETNEVFDAPILHAWNFQVGAILPSAVPLGQAELRVFYRGMASEPSAFRVVETGPGLFTIGQHGSGPGVIQNFESPNSQPLNNLTHAARPGGHLILWGTGLGAIDGPDEIAPPVGTLRDDVYVLIGSRRLKPTYAGRAPGFPGLDQINVRLPEDLTERGCYVNVGIEAARAISHGVTVSISDDGGPCEHPWNLSAERLAEIDAGGRALFLSIRVDDQRIGGIPNLTPPISHVQASGRSQRVNAAGLASLARAVPTLRVPSFDPPSPMAEVVCSVSGILVGSFILGGAFQPLPQPPPPPNPPFLGADAGEVWLLEGPNGETLEVARDESPSPLGGLQRSELRETGFFSPGEWRLRVPGGSEAEGFETTFRVPPPPDIDPPAEFSRSRDVEVRWDPQGFLPQDAVRIDVQVRVPIEDFPGASTQRGPSCWLPALAGGWVIPGGLVNSLPPGEEALLRLTVDSPLESDPVPGFDRVERLAVVSREWLVPLVE